MVIEIKGNNVILTEFVFNDMQRKIQNLENHISELGNQLENAKNKTVVQVQVKNEINESVRKHLDTKFSNLMTEIEEMKKLGIDVNYLNYVLQTIDTHIEDRIKETKIEIEFETDKFLTGLKADILNELDKKFKGNIEGFFKKRLINAINHLGGRYDDKVKILFNHTIEQLIGKTKINLLKGVPTLSLVHQDLLKQALQKASVIENRLSKKSIPMVEFKNDKK